MGAFSSSPLMLSLFNSLEPICLSPAPGPQTCRSLWLLSCWQPDHSFCCLAWLKRCYQISVHAQCPFSACLLKALCGSLRVPSSGLVALLFATVLLSPLPQGLDIWEFITSPVSCFSLYAEKPVTRCPYIPHIFTRTWKKTLSNWSDQFIDGTEAELPFLHKVNKATGNITLFNLCLVNLIQSKGIRP